MEIGLQHRIKIILKHLKRFQTQTNLPFLSVDLGLYQNAGANITQQIAYSLAHANEYLNRFPTSTKHNCFSDISWNKLLF